LRIAIDTGGTFTDCVYVRDGRIEILKVPSTPENPAQAIAIGLAEISRRLAQQSIAPLDLVCGTTVGTNALLQRRGVRVVLVTTAGFEDVLEIGRQARPKLYDVFGGRPAPLVPRERRLGLGERIGSDGEILARPSAEKIRALVREVRRARPDAVAVCFLFSFVNPTHEKLVAKALRAAGCIVTASHEVFPEIREFERTSTTVVNAYLIPVMSGYLAAIEDVARRIASKSAAPQPKRMRVDVHSKVRVMQSNGGIVSARAAASEPVRTILSGPAGGVLGAEYVASLAGYDKIISFDMGGTSTDVALLEGGARTTNESVVDDLPVSVPMLDIHTVGAGGGSIARIDRGGAMRVGPESAGADPGPAAYGKGEQPTVTDAHLVLGRLGGAGLLGGEFHLDAARARIVLDRARKKSPSLRSAEEFAQGTIEVVEATMERAIRVISVERGYDPRDYSLVAFGGAGGLHACALAAALEMPRVLIPKIPGGLSALGILRADVVRDFSRTVLMRAQKENASEPVLRNLFQRLESYGLRQMRAEGFGFVLVPPASLPAPYEDNARQRRKSRADHSLAQVRALRSVDLRYIGQSTALKIPASGDFLKAFHKEHERRYGYADNSREIEIVNVGVRLIGLTPKPSLPRSRSHGRNARRAIESKGRVYFPGKWTATPLYARSRLQAGNQFPGPAIVTDYSSTTVVLPGWRVDVDAHENLILTRANSKA
jgi:N-methylhydantoinase A